MECCPEEQMEKPQRLERGGAKIRSMDNEVCNIYLDDLGIDATTNDQTKALNSFKRASRVEAERIHFERETEKPDTSELVSTISWLQ